MTRRGSPSSTFFMRTTTYGLMFTNSSIMYTAFTDSKPLRFR